MLSLAGGLRGDAGYSVAYTAGQKSHFLAGAADDATGQFGGRLGQHKGDYGCDQSGGKYRNQPEDVISVPKADLIYIIGRRNPAATCWVK